MSASLLTPAVRDALVASARAGTPLDVSALAVGVTGHTVREWLRRGEGRDDRGVSAEYQDFAKAYREGERDFIERSLARISAAGSESWQAIAWLLERLHPEKFSARVRETVNKEIDDLFALLEERLDPEAYQQVLRVVTENRGQ